MPPGVYGHGPGYLGGGYHGGGSRCGGWGGWARPGWCHWGPGGAIAAGAALGASPRGLTYAGQPPAPGLCWYGQAIGDIHRPEKE